MSLSQAHIADAAKHFGLTVVRTLLTVTRFHPGWESDKYGWIVEVKGSGKPVGLSTNHGTLCRWTAKEIREEVAQMRAVMDDLLEADDILTSGPQKRPQPKKPKVKTPEPHERQEGESFEDFADRAVRGIVGVSAVLMTVREHRGGLDEALATATEIRADWTALLHWVQDCVGRDSSKSGSGHVTLHHFNNIVQVSEDVIDDSARVPGWNFTRTITAQGYGVIGFINSEKHLCKP